MLKSYPLVARFLVFVILPLVTVALAGLTYLRGSLPAHGVSSLKAAVQQRVDITRDKDGVVYIIAKADVDAFFALGYAHAQDRLWQLEVQRRVAQGRLSEVFGRSTVSQDAWMRTLGLYAAAESAWPKLSTQAQASLTAYAAGINAWINSGVMLPPEFLAFGVRPEAWREIDSLAWAKVFALNLAGNMKSEVANLVASQYLDPQQLADLGLAGGELPQATASVPNTLKLFTDLAAFQTQLETELKIGGRYVGSNAWVVSGTLMQGGQALLANDTHLGLQMPSLWYVAHLKGDLIDVSGMTLVGLPVVIFGRNRFVAWGGTSMMADAQDLYLEQPNPDNPTEYARAGVWEKFDTHTETISVKADFPASLRAAVEPVKVRVRKTRNGPIISDAMGALDQPVALRWTALDPGDTSYESFFRMNYAQDWDTFKQALEPYVAPALNLLYVDTSNNIASISAGKIPVRSKGEGRLPVPGWTDEHRWTGYIAFKDWPQRYNPEDGYIVSANDKPVGPDYPYFLSADWAPPQRAQRIAELLRKKSQDGVQISFSDIEQMQGDTVDLGVSGLLTYLRDVTPKNEEQKQALGYLAAWQGDMARDSTAATIFFAWTRHLRDGLFAGDTKDFWNNPQQQGELSGIVANTTYDQILNALTTASPHWCEPAPKPAMRPCATVLDRSLDHAITELKKLKGSNMESWKWGEVHATVYAHAPFSRVGPLASLFERRVPNGGSPNTINAASAVYQESIGYEQNFGAGFRQIMQIGVGQAKHVYMNSTGQSGNFLSPFYDNMVTPFRDVKYYPMTEDSEVRQGSVLTILPERS